MTKATILLAAALLLAALRPARAAESARHPGPAPVRAHVQR